MTEHTNSSNNDGAPKRVHTVIDGKRVPLDYAAARRIAETAHILERRLGTRRTKQGAEEAQRALERERLQPDRDTPAHEGPPD
jgi:hypothetical protein